MAEALFEHNKHKGKSTMTRLAEFVRAYEIPKDAVIVVAKSAVDEEFSAFAGFSKSQLFPEGHALGYKIKVGNDFTLQDTLGKPIQTKKEDE